LTIEALRDTFRWPYSHVHFIFSSSIAVLCVWGFSKTFVTLLVFCIAYGIFAGGYSVLYHRFATSLPSDDGTQVWLYSIFETRRGVVIILGGLLSGPLTSGVTDLGKYGIGSYERLILVVGISMLISSFGGIGRFFRGKGFKFAQLFRSRQTLASWG
jgi:hypothetical protein